ncbi:hypothetical protein M9H77_18347 [Catharanthus roseus]|uniref:Uncharacterized protein n=1 Tax=Catharanthus roseus TaxID=4058 RepID=A0ACC0B768_CATRO|nr:hypothetical protein M9H77_18347 [Catharanthus roseus]
MKAKSLKVDSHAERKIPIADAPLLSSAYPASLISASSSHAFHQPFAPNNAGTLRRLSTTGGDQKQSAGSWLNLIQGGVRLWPQGSEDETQFCFGAYEMAQNANPSEINRESITGVLSRKEMAKDKRAKNKRSATDMENIVGIDSPQTAKETPDGIQLDYDLNEPTMGEKLANLKLAENNEVKGLENTESSLHTKPPSADSVHVLLRQALHADDRTLLIDCLYRQDEKVIANSVSQLNPSDVLKLLQSLVPIIQSRGAVLACALPWLRSILLQHASRIMSQESSLLALNSLYQLIESRVSTFNRALKLSSSLDLLYAGNVNEGEEESEAIIPVIYEDKDESDEEIDSMYTGSEEDGKEHENLSGLSDFEDME